MKKSKRYQNRKKKQSKIRYQLKAGNPGVSVFRPAPTPESTVQEILRLSYNRDFTFNNVYDLIIRYLTIMRLNKLGDVIAQRKKIEQTAFGGPLTERHSPVIHTGPPTEHSITSEILGYDNEPNFSFNDAYERIVRYVTFLGEMPFRDLMDSRKISAHLRPEPPRVDPIRYEHPPSHPEMAMANMKGIAGGYEPVNLTMMAATSGRVGYTPEPPSVEPSRFDTDPRLHKTSMMAASSGRLHPDF